MQKITHQASIRAIRCLKIRPAGLGLGLYSTSYLHLIKLNSSIKNASLHISRNGHLGIFSLARTRRARVSLPSPLGRPFRQLHSRRKFGWPYRGSTIQYWVSKIRSISSMPLSPDRRFEHYTDTALKPSVSGPNFRASDGRTIGRNLQGLYRFPLTVRGEVDRTSRSGSCRACPQFDDLEISK